MVKGQSKGQRSCTCRRFASCTAACLNAFLVQSGGLWCGVWTRRPFLNNNDVKCDPAGPGLCWRNDSGNGVRQPRTQTRTRCFHYHFTHKHVGSNWLLLFSFRLADFANYRNDTNIDDPDYRDRPLFPKPVFRNKTKTKKKKRLKCKEFQWNIFAINR